MRQQTHSLSRPSADELAYLYQHTTTKVIAGYYGVCLALVYKWLTSDSIPIKPAISDITKDELGALWTSDLSRRPDRQSLGRQPHNRYP